ncbi:MAG: ribosome-associated translation inhibitor RaiA [Paludibacteraceae bacterium]|nr:ribosome-associated translation inhibitor RaiA [Paludibacteraceae bacterium]
MKINIQAVNFTIADKLNAYIEKKTKHFDKKIGENAEMEIRLSVVKPETNHNKETHIRILGVGKELFAQKVSDSFEQGIDEALEAIDKQIEKFKAKNK